MKYLLIFIFLFAFPVLASEVIPTKKELPKNDVCRYDSIIIKEAFENGADGYLIKSEITPDKVVSEVKSFLPEAS